MLSLIFSSCGSDGSSATDEVSASDEASSSSFLPLSSEYSISSSANIQSSSSAFQSCSSEFTANSSTSFYSSAVLPQSSSENIAATSSATTFLDPQPLWHDEFDGIALDTSKWSYEIGNGTEGWGNQEKEYYTSSQENAYISDGKLHIQATLNDGVYHSARLITKGKFSFTYGTIEARIALPVGKGIWPAFWMLGANIDEVGWPRCGEIDIIEAVNSEHIVYGTNHWANGGEYAQYGNNTHNFREQEYPLDITQFHDYKMTWDSQFIRMSIDGFTYHEISIQNNVGDTEEFHKPFFILLNVAVGGNWPGFEIDDTQFPNEMVIDYIRVYPIQNP
ncbi:MAG: glycoside hydrolase family 16 protein [Fibrobacter sp.]|nr:glycoside hydrolase family 16 protein [Fibrobacter sp.]